MSAITDPKQVEKTLASWSREVELTVDGVTKFRCTTAACESEYFVTAGRADRVRCPKCKTLYMLEV